MKNGIIGNILNNLPKEEQVCQRFCSLVPKQLPYFLQLCLESFLPFSSSKADTEKKKKQGFSFGPRGKNGCDMVRGVHVTLLRPLFLLHLEHGAKSLRSWSGIYF
jgi:hypothetical protein